MIHLATKRSIVFERTAVNDMGRKSFSISFTGFILGIDIISATFQAFGTVLYWIEALKIRATGDESSIAKSFKINVGKLSGPEAFPRFKLDNCMYTSSGEIQYFRVISSAVS
jgi:hypothetical protein